jgi:hypothetical protein
MQQDFMQFQQTFKNVWFTFGDSVLSNLHRHHSTEVVYRAPDQKHQVLISFFIFKFFEFWFAQKLYVYLVCGTQLEIIAMASKFKGSEYHSHYIMFEK